MNVRGLPHQVLDSVVISAMSLWMFLSIKWADTPVLFDLPLVARVLVFVDGGLMVLAGILSAFTKGEPD